MLNLFLKGGNSIKHHNKKARVFIAIEIGCINEQINKDKMEVGSDNFLSFLSDFLGG